MDTETPRVEFEAVIRPAIIAPELECELLSAAYVGYLEKFLFDTEKLLVAGLPGISFGEPDRLTRLLEDAHGPLMEIHVKIEGCPTPAIAAAALAYSLVPTDEEPGYSEAAEQEADGVLSEAVGAHLRSLAVDADIMVRFEVDEFGDVVHTPEKQLESV